MVKFREKSRVRLAGFSNKDPQDISAQNTHFQSKVTAGESLGSRLMRRRNSKNICGNSKSAKGSQAVRNNERK